MPSSLYKDIKDKTWNSSVKKTILVTLQAYKLHSTLYWCLHWINVRNTKVCTVRPKWNVENKNQIWKPKIKIQKHIKLKFRNKIGRFFIFFRFSNFGILTKLGHFLLLNRTFSYNPTIKPFNISIYIVKSFLKSNSFKEIRASSTVSSETNRADKIIVAM